MPSFLYPLSYYSDWGILALRLAIGIIFLAHAQGKLKNIKSFMGFIGTAELLGGLAMIVGFLIQLAALGLGIIMAGAIYKKTQEWHVPFFTLEKMGWEFDFILLAACIALLTIGAGSVSLDYTMFGY
jgi:putative oxidoreductase